MARESICKWFQRSAVARQSLAFLQPAIPGSVCLQLSVLLFCVVAGLAHFVDPRATGDSSCQN